MVEITKEQTTAKKPFRTANIAANVVILIFVVGAIVLNIWLLNSPIFGDSSQLIPDYTHTTQATVTYTGIVGIEDGFTSFHFAYDEEGTRAEQYSYSENIVGIKVEYLNSDGQIQEAVIKNIAGVSVGDIVNIGYTPGEDTCYLLDIVCRNTPVENATFKLHA